MSPVFPFLLILVLSLIHILLTSFPKNQKSTFLKYPVFLYVRDFNFRNFTLNFTKLDTQLSHLDIP
jgi:hypothetical protein